MARVDAAFVSCACMRKRLMCTRRARASGRHTHKLCACAACLAASACLCARHCHGDTRAAARNRRGARAPSRAFRCRRGGVRAFGPRRRKGHRRGRRRRLGPGCAPRQRLHERRRTRARAPASLRAHASSPAPLRSRDAWLTPPPALLSTFDAQACATRTFRRRWVTRSYLTTCACTTCAPHSRMNASLRVHRFTHHPSCAGLVCGRHGLLFRKRRAAGGAGREPVPARADSAGALHVFVQRGRPLRQRPGARARKNPPFLRK
jgi:hypothetical protein